MFLFLRNLTGSFHFCFSVSLGCFSFFDRISLYLFLSSVGSRKPTLLIIPEVRSLSILFEIHKSFQYFNIPTHGLWKVFKEIMLDPLENCNKKSNLPLRNVSTCACSKRSFPRLYYLYFWFVCVYLYKLYIEHCIVHYTLNIPDIKCRVMEWGPWWLLQR